MRLTKKEKIYLHNLLFHYENRFECDENGNLIDNETSIEDDKLKQSILNKIKL